MKTTKLAKTSPKKGNPVEASGKMLNTIEHKTKDLEIDLKTWHEGIVELEKNASTLEKGLKNEVVLKVTEVSKIFSDSQSQLEKMNKDVEATQKRFHKMQEDFDKKLVMPLANGGFIKQSISQIDSTKANNLKIQAILDANKKLLDEIVEKCQRLIQRLMALEENIRKICLPERMDDALKINQKLNERMEVLCQETAGLKIGAGPEIYNPKVVAAPFLQLFESHRKGEQYLLQIQTNLRKVELAVGGVPGAAAAAVVVAAAEPKPM